jgi:hypothetical protein
MSLNLILETAVNNEILCFLNNLSMTQAIPKIKIVIQSIEKFLVFMEPSQLFETQPSEPIVSHMNLYHTIYLARLI